MRYLRATEVLIMHARILDATGGAHGLRDMHLFGSAIEKPKLRLGGKEMYQGIFKKAAVYLEAFANYHVFIDGNKRTALAAATRFLALNGYELAATNKQVEVFVLGIATKKYDVDDAAAWLKAHTTRATA